MSLPRPRTNRAQRASAPRLFAPEELALRPTGQARLKAMAQRPPRSATEREAFADENRKTMEKLRRWGRELGCLFDLRYASLEPERESVTEHYGVCYEDGAIRIRLRHAKTRRLLKESSLVDTLCHELAHLKHLNHGLRFRRLYQQILDEARRLGIYRPGPSETPRPRQGSLFDDHCGTRPLGNRHATTV